MSIDHSPGAEPGQVEALLFDGRQGRPTAVSLGLEAGWLVARSGPTGRDPTPEEPSPAASSWRWPLADVTWPERTRHGQRLLLLKGGGSLQIVDATAFDAWRRGAVGRDSWVVRAQQSWRATLLAVVLLIVTGVGSWLWGVPLVARLVVQMVPKSVDEAVGAAALDSIGQSWLKPSQLPQARQDAIRAAFADAVADSSRRAGSAENAVPWTLRFQAADKAIGPNAFALPGGTIVVTDALVDLLAGADDTLIGVLAHERGHLQRRHGMRALVQVALVGAATSVALGDFSSLLAGVPAVLAQLDYSRDAEREADAEAARLLRDSGRSPAAMVVLFERLQGRRAGRASLPIALASHPIDEARVRFFQDQAARR